MAKNQNSGSTPKVPATPEVQNTDRRAKKAAQNAAARAAAAAGRGAARHDMNVRPYKAFAYGAARPANEVKRADKKSARRIEAEKQKAAMLDKFQQQVDLALVHPAFTELVEGSPAHKVAKAILDTFVNARPDKAAKITKTSAAIEAARGQLSSESISATARARGISAARTALREAGAVVNENTAKAPAPEPALV